MLKLDQNITCGLLREAAIGGSPGPDWASVSEAWIVRNEIRDKSRDRPARSVQGGEAVRFQHFDDAVDDQADTDCRNEEADDARRGIDPHHAQFL